MPRKLTRLKIAEVSTVDKGAGEGTQIVLRKRDPGAVFRKIFGVPTPGDELRASLHKAASLPKPKDPEVDEADTDVHQVDGDGEFDDDEVAANKQSRHHVEVIANLLVRGSNGLTALAELRFCVGSIPQQREDAHLCTLVNKSWRRSPRATAASKLFVNTS
jgi:hypothetical protein